MAEYLSGREKSYLIADKWFKMYTKEIGLKEKVHRNAFRRGMCILKSCGGPTLDIRTMESWYQMLKGVNADDFQAAIMDIAPNNSGDDLVRMNIVYEIKSHVNANFHKKNLLTASEERKKWENDEEVIPPEQAIKMLGEFNKKLKGLNG